MFSLRPSDILTAAATVEKTVSNGDVAKTVKAVEKKQPAKRKGMQDSISNE